MIKFQCAHCSHIFDQSKQSYNGIRVIKSTVICPKRHSRLLISDEETEIEKKVSSITFIAAASFLVVLVYSKYHEDADIPSYVYITFIGIFFVGRIFCYISQGMRGHSKHSKTERI